MLDDVLSRLSARLPELEWKLSLQTPVINPSLLPRGLFRSRIELTPQGCVDEIKADLQAIGKQDNEQIRQYLTERVGQKINVLVRICQNYPDKKKLEQQVNFGVQAINTRQQWLQTMQDNIDTLSRQQQALAMSLVKLKAENSNIQAVLSLEAELGKAGQRLTLAQETMARSTVF